MLSALARPGERSPRRAAGDKHPERGAFQGGRGEAAGTRDAGNIWPRESVLYRPRARVMDKAEQLSYGAISRGRSIRNLPQAERPKGLEAGVEFKSDGRAADD